MLAFVKTVLPKVRGERGISLIEIIVVLGVVATLSAVVIPITLNYVEDAKKVRAESEVKSIGSMILRLTRDVAHFPLFKDGTKTAGDTDFDILQGPGNPPLDHDTDKWLTTSKIGELEDHLVKNNPGTKKYASDGRFAWRGYLDRVPEDPWGNRYLVNIKNANPAENPAKVVYALSAGPNGKIETKPNELADSGPTPGGDDIVARIK